jgi:DNA invertase Pin-like site-specific DNA recombinase
MGANNAAIYARVSTGGQKASLDTQIEICKRAAALRELNIVSVRSEVISGTSRRLPERIEMLKAAKLGNFGTLLVSRLDRFGRSLVDLLATLRELEAFGVNFVSVEDGVDFSTQIGRLQAGLLAVFADFEKNLILERAQEGREAARLKGVRFGRRPSFTADAGERIWDLLCHGYSQAEVARALNVHRAVVYRVKEKYQEMTARISPPFPST